MATSTPNLVKISETAAELWRFPFSKMTVGRHLGFCCRSKVALRRLRTVRVYHLAKFGENISNSSRVTTIFRFTKWRPAAILAIQTTYKTTHDGALAVLSVLSNFVLIWLIVSKILNIQFFLRLAWNRLTTPTFWYAHFLLVLWGFDTLNNSFSHRHPQKAHPWVKTRRLRYRSWKSVHPFLL